MLAIGAYLVVTHEINPGLLMAGSLLLGRALGPIDQMIGSWKGFVAAKVQYDRLSKVLDDLSKEPERMPLPAPEGQIQVENLVVAPPGAKAPVIRNMSFVVPAGSIVGIVGPSAAGKSTLVRALMGIWPPQHGVVRLDGADIASWDKQALGQYVATCRKISSCSKVASAKTSHALTKSTRKKWCRLHKWLACTR